MFIALVVVTWSVFLIMLNFLGQNLALLDCTIGGGKFKHWLVLKFSSAISNVLMGNFKIHRM